MRFDNPPNLTPLPPVEMKVDAAAEYAFTSVVVAIGVVAVAYALYLSRRTASWLPVLCLLGGALCITIEPLCDSHLQLWWGDFRQPDIIAAWGRHVPVMAMVIVSWYYGAGAYFTWRWLQRGDGSKIWYLYLGEVATALVMEPVAIKLNLWHYFGEHGITIFGYPAYWPFVAAGCSAAAGVLLYLVGPFLPGWRILAVAALVPMTVSAVYWACGWPMYIAVNKAPAELVLWLMNGVSIGLSLLLVWICTLAARVQVSSRPIDFMASASSSRPLIPSAK